MSQYDEPKILLNAIESWYDINGSTCQIPDSDYKSEDLAKAFAEAFNGSSNHTVSYGGGEMHEVSGKVLPLLAGIKLGFSLSTLKDIILHHDIGVSDIDNIDFADELLGGDPVIKHRNGSFCSIIDFVTTSYQAMSLASSRHFDMSHASDTKSITQLGLMHTEHEDFWPSHHIKIRAQTVQEVAPSSLKNNWVSQHDFAHIITRLNDESSFPNASPMDFLIRIGMLLPETAKRSTAHYSFWEETAEQSMSGNTACTKLLEYCANHPNPDVQKRVNQALLSLGGYEFMDDAGAMYNHFKSIFNNDTYRDTFSKIVPRINLVPYDPGEFLAYFPEDREYCNFLNHKETILSVVAKEILEQPVEELGYNQLYVFAKLKCLEIPAQRIEGFNPEALINHIVDGIGAYSSKKPLINCHKQRMDLEVKTSLAELISLVQLNHKIDYKAFEHRTSSEKALLITSGFLREEMTGLTYQDKGYIFTQELGV